MFREADQLIGLVTSEQLITAIATEHHRHVLAGELRNVIHRQRGLIPERLVEMADEFLQRVRERLREILFPQRQDMVIGFEVRCDDLGIGRFIPLRSIESDGERFQRPQAGTMRIGDDGARIEPAAQEDTQRNFAHEANPHGLFEERIELLSCVLSGLAPERLPPRISNANRGDRHLSAVVDQPVGSRQLPDVSEHRPRFGHCSVPEIGHDGLGLRFGQRGIGGQDGFYFRAEEKLVASLRIKERLLSKAIAREQQPLRLLVPERETEHSAQITKTFDAFFFEHVRDHFGVGVRAKDVTSSGQLGAQLEIVVDFAVEHDLHRSIFVGYRLPAAGDVDDAEPPHAQADGVVHEKSVRVRSSMDQRVRHPPDDGSDRIRCQRRIYDSGYAAHRCFLDNTSI